MDHPERFASTERCRIGAYDWSDLGEKLRMQKSERITEKLRPHILIRTIEDSDIPLGEEEPKLQKIKGKVEHDEQLSREDEAFLTRLVERAIEWQKGLKSSSDTEPEDTMSG